MSVLRSLRAFVAGPVAVVVGLAGVALTVATLINSEHFWIWISVALTAVVGVLFLRFHQTQVKDVGSELDELIKRILGALQELPSEPVPQTEKAGVSYSMFPDPSIWDVVIELETEVRGLLEDERPSMLPVFAEAAERRRDELQVAQAKAAEDDGGLPDTQRLSRFVGMSHKQPVIRLEAILYGASEVRNRL